MARQIRIEVEDAHAMWRNGATILDVRDAEDFAEATEQPRGSFRIDPEQIPRRFGDLPRERPVLAYCE